MNSAIPSPTYVQDLVASYISDASDEEKAALVQELKDFARALCETSEHGPDPDGLHVNSHA